MKTSEHPQPHPAVLDGTSSDPPVPPPPPPPPVQRVRAPPASHRASGRRACDDSGGTPRSPGDLLTADDVAARLRVTRKTVYEMVRAGTLPHLHLGRRIRFRSTSLDRWLADLERGPDAEERTHPSKRPRRGAASPTAPDIEPHDWAAAPYLSRTSIAAGGRGLKA